MVGPFLWSRLDWLISNWLAHAFVVRWQVSRRLDDLRRLYSHIWHLTGCQPELQDYWLGCLSSQPHSLSLSSRLGWTDSQNDSARFPRSAREQALMFKFFSNLFCGTKHVTWPSQIHVVGKQTPSLDRTWKQGREEFVAIFRIYHTFQDEDGNIRCHTFKPEGPLGGKEKVVEHKGACFCYLESQS